MYLIQSPITCASSSGENYSFLLLLHNIRSSSGWLCSSVQQHQVLCLA
uniref:Uncharacterized protein n=1 Tax=Arundo donax TaxID=35708 RepID=A0A0A9F749_ARUDO